MAKSFYDLDYIVEINEKRLEEYTSYYQKILERLTHIILIYSALGIFLIPLIQRIFERNINSIIFYSCLVIFILLFIVSLVFTVRLVLPVDIAYLMPPEKYYKTIRGTMEQIYPGNQNKVDASIKGSYILELEKAISNNETVWVRKSSFHYKALIFALLAVIPYLICVGYHLTKKEDSIQKVELINKKK